MLAAAMACSAALALWFARGSTFWVDEITVFMDAPNLGVEEALLPHLGHLALVSRLLYKAMFELFGTNYLPFRLFTLVALFLLVGLVFTYLKRRVGAWVALAPCLVLLFFGSDSIHVLAGNGFTVLFGISAGVGSFLALERGDRRGDIAACALLTLGVATYSFALGFLAGAIVWIALDDDRLRRSWVVLVPLVLYGAWFLWSRLLVESSGPATGVDPLNLLATAGWCFQSLSAVLAAFTGLGYQFEGGSPAPQVGPVLAIGAAVLIGLRLGRGEVPRELWAAIAALVALWVFGAATAGGIRFPENSRYFFPVGIVLLMAAAGSLRGVRWSRPAIVALYVFSLAGLATNLILLRDAGAMLRGPHTATTKTSYAALDIAGSAARGTIPVLNEEGAPAAGYQAFSVPFDIFEARGESPIHAYQEAAARYGSMGYPLAELRTIDEGLKGEADKIIARALGVELQTTSRPAGGPGCRRVGGEGQGPVTELPPGGAVVEMEGAGGPASVGRFTDTEPEEVGSLEPSVPAVLRIPRDNAPDPWRLSVAADGILVVCPLR